MERTRCFFPLFFHANLSFSSLPNLLVDAFNYARAFAGAKRHQGKKHLFFYAHIRSDFSSYSVSCTPYTFQARIHKIL